MDLSQVTFEQVQVLLGGFGTALLVFLGTFITNKKDATKTLIESYQKQNEALQAEVKELKQENRDNELVIDQLRKDVHNLKLEIIKLKGGIENV